jgi:hypothetical protein
VPECPANGHS